MRQVESDQARYARTPADLVTGNGAVSGNALAVWANLALEADYGPTGRVKMTVRELAHRCGFSGRSVERRLAELRKTGRLINDAGKLAGSACTFTLIFAHRRVLRAVRNELLAQLSATKGGTPAVTHRSDTVDGPIHKGVNQLIPTQQTPDKTKETATAGLWSEFEKIYPVRVRMHRAQGVFAGLPEAEQRAAIAGARALAVVFAAATDAQRAYTPNADRWLSEKRWNDAPTSVEVRYKVPGAIRRANRPAAAPDEITLAFRRAHDAKKKNHAAPAA